MWNCGIVEMGMAQMAIVIIVHKSHRLLVAGAAFDAEMRNLSDRKIAVVGKPGGASVNKERNQTVKDGESGRKTVSCRRFNPVPASMEGGSR